MNARHFAKMKAEQRFQASLKAKVTEDARTALQQLQPGKWRRIGGVAVMKHTRWDGSHHIEDFEIGAEDGSTQRLVFEDALNHLLCTADTVRINGGVR